MQQAQALLEAGRLEEAKAKVQQAEKLDVAYDDVLAVTPDYLLAMIERAERDGLLARNDAPRIDARGKKDARPGVVSKPGPSPRNGAVTPAMSPSSLASINGPGAASGTGTVPGGDSPHAVPVLSSEPRHPVEGLVVPEWIAQKLNSPKVRVRLRALETWAQSIR